MILSVNISKYPGVVYAYDINLKDDTNRYLYIDWLTTHNPVWQKKYYVYKSIHPEEEHKFLGYLPSEVM